MPRSSGLQWLWLRTCAGVRPLSCVDCTAPSGTVRGHSSSEYHCVLVISLFKSIWQQNYQEMELCIRNSSVLRGEQLPPLKNALGAVRDGNQSTADHVTLLPRHCSPISTLQLPSPSSPRVTSARPSASPHWCVHRALAPVEPVDTPCPQPSLFSPGLQALTVWILPRIRLVTLQVTFLGIISRGM